MTAPHHVDLGEYQEFVERLFVSFPKQQAGEENLFPAILGVQEELGEIARLLKRECRDGLRDRNALRKELGDLLYWVTFLASDLGFELEDIILANIAKLKDREARGVIRGTGDNR